MQVVENGKVIQNVLKNETLSIHNLTTYLAYYLHLAWTERM